MPFVRRYMDWIGEVFSGVQPLFSILIWKSVELWSDLSPWLQWGEEEGTRLGLMVIEDVRLSWSNMLIIVGAGTVLLWTGIYSAKHKVQLIDYAGVKVRYSTNCLRNLDDCTSANAWWRTLKSNVLGRSQMFLLFVLMVVSLFQILRRRLRSILCVWHLCVSSSKMTVWLVTQCVVFFLHSMWWEDQPVECCLRVTSA